MFSALTFFPKPSEESNQPGRLYLSFPKNMSGNESPKGWAFCTGGGGEVNGFSVGGVFICIINK